MKLDDVHVGADYETYKPYRIADGETFRVRVLGIVTLHPAIGAPNHMPVYRVRVSAVDDDGKVADRTDLISASELRTPWRPDIADRVRAQLLARAEAQRKLQHALIVNDLPGLVMPKSRAKTKVLIELTVEEAEHLSRELHEARTAKADR